MTKTIRAGGLFGAAGRGNVSERGAEVGGSDPGAFPDRRGKIGADAKPSRREPVDSCAADCRGEDEVYSCTLRANRPPDPAKGFFPTFQETRGRLWRRSITH